MINNTFLKRECMAVHTNEAFLKCMWWKGVHCTYIQHLEAASIDSCSVCFINSPPCSQPTVSIYCQIVGVP